MNNGDCGSMMPNGFQRFMSHRSNGSLALSAPPQNFKRPEVLGQNAVRRTKAFSLQASTRLTE